MTAPLQILIVDDEESIRFSLAGYLEDHDYGVVSVSSAEEALQRLEKEHYDLGIIDLRLPGMSGESLIIKAQRIDANMRFLIHTGSTNYSLSDELRAIGLSDDDILSKPQYDLSRFILNIKRKS